MVFVFGLLVGGLISAALLALVGVLLFRWWISAWLSMALVSGAFVLATLADLRVLALPKVHNARQVPQAVQRRGPVVGALQFGVEMGSGARTFMTGYLPLVVALALVLIVPWQGVALIGISFGAGRSIVPLVRASSHNDSHWSNNFMRHARLIQGLLSVVCLAAWASTRVS